MEDSDLEEFGILKNPFARNGIEEELLQYHEAVEVTLQLRYPSRASRFTILLWYENEKIIACVEGVSVVYAEGVYGCIMARGASKEKALQNIRAALRRWIENATPSVIF